MLNCVIIDDEPLAREGIANYVEKVEYLRLTGTGSNPVELAQLVDTQRVDLIFLDIQMPVINGIDYLRTVSHPPMVIIITAYPSFALEGFQLDVLDYLLKPVTFERFFKAVNKANDYHRLSTRTPADPGPHANDPAEDYFFVKCDCKYEKICFGDILYVQALQNYVAIHTIKRKYLTLLNLKSVEDNLDKRSFIRVHRSYIVSIPMIEAIENNELVVRAARIPISRNYRDEVIDRVVLARLWKKSKDL